jgi:hypothetical protein
MTAIHWVALALSIGLMAWMEGYRGFQLRFCPRVVARLQGLSRPGCPPALRLLAPFHCLGLLGLPRRELIGGWSLLIGIVTLVLLIRLLPQPWRGIVDGGVLVGLGWGAAAVAIMGGRALLGAPNGGAQAD